MEQIFVHASSEKYNVRQCHLFRENELVIYAADRMIEKEIDSIPIVRKKDNQKYEVIGRISKATIAKLLVALYKE